MALPTHIFITYETSASLTFCSAVIGYINHIPTVLLIERNENRLTSITNAIAEVVEAATPHALKLFRQNPCDPDNEIAWLPHEEADILWLEAYEYRITSEVYTDPAIMRIDVENESWWPIDAPTADGLAPFLQVFRAENR